MTRDHELGSRLEVTLDRGRPLQRIAVTERRRSPLFEQVAGEQDSVDEHGDVGVGVAPATECEAHAPTADVDRGRVREDLVRRHYLARLEIGGEIAEVLLRGGDQLVGGIEHHLPATLVPPDLGRREDGVAENVVPVPMGVDDPPHRLRGDLGDRGPHHGGVHR